MDITMLNNEPVISSFLKVKLPTGFTPISFDIEEHAENMQLEYRISDDNKIAGIVLFSLDNQIAPGIGKVISIGLERTGLSRSDDIVDDSEFKSIQFANTGLGLLGFEEVSEDELVRIISEMNNPLPTVYSLSPAYPNPFNPITTVPYELPEKCDVNISVYDIQGRLITQIINDRKSAGYHQIKFDGSNMSAGTYIVNMSTSNFTSSQKIVLLK